MKATEAQICFMESLGLEVKADLTKNEATILITKELLKRKKAKESNKKRLLQNREAMTEFFLDSESVMDSNHTKSNVRKIVEDL